CAPAASGHAAAPPRSVMNSRRRRQIPIWPFRAREPCRGEHSTARAYGPYLQEHGETEPSALSRRVRDDGNLDRHHQPGRGVMKASVRKAATTLRRPAASRNNDRRVLGPHPRRRFLWPAGTAVLPAVSRVAWTQAFPTRPITMIVPIAAGSSLDVLGRLVAE